MGVDEIVVLYIPKEAPERDVEINNIGRAFSEEPEYLKNCEQALAIIQESKGYLRDVPLMIQHVTAELYNYPELFELNKRILDLSLQLHKKRKRVNEFETKEEEEVFASGLWNYFYALSFAVQSSKIDDPDFKIVMESCEQILRNNICLPSPDKYVLNLTVASMVGSGLKTLRDIKANLPEKQQRSIENYLLNAGALASEFSPFSYHIAGLEDLISDAREQGYEEQLYAMIDLLGHIRHNSTIGSKLSINPLTSESGFLETCKELQDIGKLDYYTQVVRRLHKIAFVNPTNLEILREGRLAKIIQAYESAGLGNRFFKVLDFVVSKHENDRPLEIEEMDYMTHIDMWFHFFSEFPEINKKYGEKSFELFEKAYNAIGKVFWHSIKDGIDKFFGDGLEKRISYDEWLGQLQPGLGLCVTPMDKSNYLNLSFAAISNGVSLDYLRNFLPHLLTIKVFGNGVMDILNEDVDDKTKMGYLDYLAILEDIPNLPKVRCNEEWLKEVSNACGLDFNFFLNWLEKYRTEMIKIYTICRDEARDLVNPWGFITGKNRYTEMIGDINRYRNTVPELVRNGVNPQEALNLRDKIDFLWEAYSIKQLKQIVNSVFDTGLKRRYIGYLSVLGKIPSLPDVRPDEIWLRESAEFLGKDYERFVGWLDALIADINFKYKDEYIKAIPFMLENDVDFIQAYHLRNYLRFSDHLDELVKMGSFINDNASIDNKIKFFEFIKGKEFLIEFLEPDIANPAGWVKRAEKAAQDYFKSINIHISYPGSYVLKLLRSTFSARDELVKLARFEEQGNNIKQLFKPRKIYGTEQVFGLSQRLDPILATRLLLYGLISRRQDRQLEAMGYFLPEKVIKARDFITKSHIPSHKFYSKFRNEITAFENGSKNNRELGLSIVNAFRENYLSSSSNSEGKIELRELVWLVESLYEDKEIFNKITAKMQDSTLYDLSDGQRLLCCAMISDDRENTEIESLYYALDPYIGLMHVVPSLNGVYGMPIGAAIMANTHDRSYNDVLLVDSMEGGTLFECINPNVSFRLAARGVIGAALDTGTDNIFFNTKVGNSTSRKFNAYIANLLGFRDVDEVELTKFQGIQYTDRKRRLLEAFKDREELSGPVTGYMVNTTELECAIK